LEAASTGDEMPSDTVHDRAVDGELLARVKEGLGRRGLGGEHLRIEVLGSHVILEGAVRTWFDLDVIERAVWDVPGVLSLDNRLQAVEGGATAEAEQLP